jgi:membrane protease YdiL (CAAX protease family)
MTQKPGAPETIFIGPNGLRSGWRFLLFVIGIILAGYLIERPLSLFLIRIFKVVDLHELSARAVITVEFLSCISVFAVTAIFALFERRRIDSYGLPVEHAFGKLFWKGMAAGLAAVVFVAVAMILTGGMVIRGWALHGIRIPKLTLLWLIANLLIGISEEYTFRGYALQSLWRGAGFWPAALITTAIFAGDHLEKPGENAMDIGMIFFLGLVLCISVQRTGSLWFAAGWHAAFDFGQLFLIGTRNGGIEPAGHLLNVSFPGSAWLNGGHLGTEASIFMVPVAIATFVYVFWFLKGERKTDGESSPP